MFISVVQTFKSAALFAVAGAVLAGCGSPEANTGADESAAAVEEPAAASPGETTSAKKGAQQATPQPTIGLDSFMKTTLYKNGGLYLTEYDLIFAPQGGAQTKAVVKSKGKEVASFGFFPEYRYGQGVFGRLKAENHASATLAPGDYVMEFTVEGELATSVPFKVVADAASDDPFNPEQTVHFEGPWQQFAYLTFKPFKETETVNVNFWVSSSDIDSDKRSEPVSVKLKRNGKLVAHSRVTQGLVTNNEILRKNDLTLYHPHERKDEYRAVVFSKEDLSQNGKYTLSVELTDSGKVLRDFKFSAKGGQLTPHPRTELGYKPRADYIAPRVLKPGTTTYEFVEAYWIETP